jgi:hypothetical protein
MRLRRDRKHAVPATKALVLALTLFGSINALAAVAEPTYRSTCRVAAASRLGNARLDGKTAEVTHFSCKIRGGPLDGFVVTGTNIWSPEANGRQKLLGSIAIAQKAGSSVLYEVYEASRSTQFRNGVAVGWESSSWGRFLTGTGSAAGLSGKTFTSTVRSTVPGGFTSDTWISE